MPKGNNGIISAQDPDSFRVGADSADGGPSRRTSRQMLCGGPAPPAPSELCPLYLDWETARPRM